MLPSLSLLFVLAIGALFATGVLRNGAPAAATVFEARQREAVLAPAWHPAPAAAVAADGTLDEGSHTEDGDPDSDDEVDGELTPLAEPPAVVPAGARRLASALAPLSAPRPGHAHRREHPPKA